MQLRHFEWAKGQWFALEWRSFITHRDRPDPDGRRTEITLRHGGVEEGDGIPRGWTRSRGVTHTWRNAVAQSVRLAAQPDLILTCSARSCPEARLSALPFSCPNRTRVRQSPIETPSLKLADSYTRKEYNAMIDVALGGRAAEEMIFGHDDVTSGCSSDLTRATDVATRMIRVRLTEPSSVRLSSYPPELRLQREGRTRRAR